MGEEGDVGARGEGSEEDGSASGEGLEEAEEEGGSEDEDEAEGSEVEVGRVELGGSRVVLSVDAEKEGEARDEEAG